MKRVGTPPLFFPSFRIEPQSTACASGCDIQEVQEFLYRCAQQAIHQQQHVVWITAQTDLPHEISQFQQSSPYFHVLQKNRLSVLFEQPDVETFTSKWKEYCEQHPVDFMILDNINEIACHQSDAIREFFTASRRFREHQTLIIGSQETTARIGIQGIVGTIIKHSADLLLSIDGRSGHVVKNRYGMSNEMFTF